MAHVVVVASAAVRTVAVVMVQAVATAQGQGGYSDEDAHFKEILVHDRKWGQGLKGGLYQARRFSRSFGLWFAAGFEFAGLLLATGLGFGAAGLLLCAMGFGAAGL